MASLLLGSSIVSADDVVDEINITVPVSCNLEGTGMNSHNATLNNGQYNSAIGETTIKAYCNDNEGFAIYAIGYTDNEEGKNVLTSSTLGSTHDIVTGTATSGSTSNWAMKLSTITSPAPTYPITIQNSYDSFQEIPDDYTLVAKRTSATDIGAGAEGSTLKTTYQAYVGPTQPAGTYIGQVKYTLVHPHDRNAPQKPFACRPHGATIDTITCMQDISSTNKSTILASMTESVAYVLYDSRDQQQYHIAKLADGNIWMLDNLALDPTDSTTAANMSASNTNASSEAIYNLLNGGGTATGWSTAAVESITNDWDATQHNYFLDPIINNQSKDTLVTSYGPASAGGQAKAGIYYNFCAATASTFCYDYDSDPLGEFINVSQDLCPANWRMPSGWGSGTGEYYNLAQHYSDIATQNNSFQYNLSITLSGFLNYASIVDQNSYGYWWSSTANRVNVYTLGSNATTVEPINADYADYGNSIRCLVGTH